MLKKFYNIKFDNVLNTTQTLDNSANRNVK
jgi:hypothetical protein